MGDHRAARRGSWPINSCSFSPPLANKILHGVQALADIVQHQGRTIAEFPLTAGVLATVLAPVLAAVGALVALLKDCTIHIERFADEPKKKPETQSVAR